MSISRRSHCDKVTFKGAAFGALLCGAAAAALVAAPLLGPPAAGATAPRSALSAGATYYLAIGASESLGVQPTPVERMTATSPREEATDHGYADALLALERRPWPTLQLEHFGCAGVTVAEALRGGGTCSFPGGSEVAAAVRFLEDHPTRAVLATVDLGFNDVSPCFLGATVYAACVSGGLATVARDLPVVLQELRVAGGPRMRIVGLLHNDPYLAAYLDGPAGRRFSSAALSAVDELNATLESVYRRTGALVADMPAAFSVGTTAPVAFGAHERVPKEVAAVCTLSWMCDRDNIHLNAAGYEAAAGAVAAALSRSPGPGTY